jgi:O-antigen/teichoic acid export membrane protein
MSAVITKPELRGDPGLSSVVPHARLLSVSQIIRRLFRMAILFLSARMLGVESFGTYAVLLTVVEMIAVVSGYGYVDFLTREVAQRPDAVWPLGKKVTGVRLAYLVPSIGVALLVLFVLRFSSSLILNAALLAVTLIPRALGESAQGLLKGLRRFAPLPWIEFVQGATVMAAAAVFLAGGFGIRGVIAAEILGAVAGAIVSVWNIASRLSFQVSDAGTFRDLLRSTLAFNVYPFIANVYDRVDVVLLAKLAGSFAAGIYALPYRVFAVLLIVPYAAMGALLPVFSASSGAHDPQETCSNVMKFLFLTALLVVLVTFAFAAPVVLFFFGPSYADSIITVKILVWAGVPAFLNFALNTLLLAAHKERAFLWTGTICTVFNIGANILLIPRFSFIGAAAVTVATECLLLAQNLYLVKKFMGRMIFPRDARKIMVIFASMMAAFWFFQRNVSQLLVGSVACAAFLFLAIWMVTGLRQLPAAAAGGRTK